MTYLEAVVAENRELRTRLARLQSEVDGIFGNDLNILRGRIGQTLIYLRQMRAVVTDNEATHYRIVVEEAARLLEEALGGGEPEPEPAA